ncbi:hypothetical protein NDU88_004880 [Pleurodeles waltl]|uniref:Uncharacterized protein n=1 Tax=Pleurodeles waltl TaxID=8319 RepID=A0AAV7W9U4_PLEWA|nr:hypothetical protein NDU88_004880 [Pleurodeles waltl]
MSAERRCHNYPVPPQKMPNSGLQDLDDLPGRSGTTGQLVTQAHSQSTTEPLSPGHVNQQCANLYRDPRQHFIPKTVMDLGSVAVGTPFSGQRHRPTVTLGGLLCARGGKTREPTLQEALSEILGAYQHSQDTMGQILDILQENRWLQEGQYQGIREDLQALNPTLISIAGVLADMADIMREATAHQRAPTTSQSIDQPSTFAAASEQDAPPQDPQATSTPPPAEGEPPRKRSMRPGQKPETLAKTTTRKLHSPDCLPCVPLSHLVHFELPFLPFLWPLGHCTYATNRLEKTLDFLHHHPIPLHFPLNFLAPQ